MVLSAVVGLNYMKLDFHDLLEQVRPVIYYMLLINTDIKDKNGESPLDSALNRNKLDTALYLINHDFDSDEDKSKAVVESLYSG